MINWLWTSIIWIFETNKDIIIICVVQLDVIYHL